jgi:DNA-directed RNA polymerase subunit alpha
MVEVSTITAKHWHGLIKPKSVEIESSKDPERYAKFVVKPLERGYGITIGNSLRRILLGSLSGVSITQVRIQGVMHEFSTIPHVSEDVADIILNLKQVRFKMFTSDAKVIRIDKKGPGSVTAKDLITDDQVVILNPDQHIATLDRGAHIQGELVLSWGRGFVPAENNKEANAPIGTIAVDAMFSPVRRVNYNVTHARVGQRTDYDRLTLEVWTDGSVKPEDAVAFASKILKDQLAVFINFDDQIEEVPDVKENERQKLFDLLNRSVDELELSVRSANCLQNAGIRFIGELVGKTEGEMLKTKNFGRKSLNEIKDILLEMGLGLGMKIDGWEMPAQVATGPKEDFDMNSLEVDDISYDEFGNVTGGGESEEPNG